MVHICECMECCESEVVNHFWGDCYHYQEKHGCDKDTAIAAVTELYNKMGWFDEEKN